MTADVRTELSKEFAKSEVQSFQGRGGQTFDYIEDETVMDRLDEVFGVGMWSFTVEAVSLADGVVKGRLAVGDAVYEDFGYSTRADGEALKEAVSDCIRRCGRFLGIGRYLYKKHTSPNGRQPVQNAPGRPAPARLPVRAPQAVPDDPYPANLDPDGLTPIEDTIVDNLICAEHRVPWRGEPGDRYHKKTNPAPGENIYCRHPENVQKPARGR